MALKELIGGIGKAVLPNKSYGPLPPISVSDIMTRDVVSLLPSQSFAEAVGLMANRPFRHVLVIHPNGRLAGVISDRDLLRVMGGTTDWKEKRISDVMSEMYLPSHRRLLFLLPFARFWVAG